MSRMNQVMQIGNIEGDILYYIEDYAYTYLKKQKGKEKTKYYLYGEKEENNKQKKVYIYGIAEKPKMEQTYFKEYYPLGFLKMNQDEIFWINLKGQEQKITGYYVFYAPNQAMQEYLVDHQKEGTTDKPQDKTKRQLDRDVLPMKETFVSAKKVKKQKDRDELKNEKFIFPIGGIILACLVLVVLTSANGQKKVEIFRQVIAETMSGMIKEIPEEDLIIEEKSIDQESPGSEEKTYENSQKSEETVDTSSTSQQEAEKQDFNLQENVVQKSKNNSLETESEKQDSDLTEASGKEQEEVKYNAEISQDNIHNTDIQKNESEEKAENLKKEYEEYVVKNGDTLVAICKTKYGTLIKMEEICNINNIKNADYIAPGQKLYLP